MCLSYIYAKGNMYPRYSLTSRKSCAFHGEDNENEDDDTFSNTYIVIKREFKE